jgi:hypothetical protein
MQHLMQTILQQWERTAVREVTTRDTLLLTTSAMLAMLAMLLVGCGKSDEDNPFIEAGVTPANNKPVASEIFIRKSYEQGVNSYQIEFLASDFDVADQDSLTLSVTGINDQFTLMNGDVKVSENQPVPMLFMAENSSWNNPDFPHALTMTLTLNQVAIDALSVGNSTKIDVLYTVFDGKDSSFSGTVSLTVEADLDVTNLEEVFAAVLQYHGLTSNSTKQDIHNLFPDAGGFLQFVYSNSSDTDQSWVDVEFESLSHDPADKTAEIEVIIDGGDKDGIRLPFTQNTTLVWDDNGEISLG